MLLLGGGAAIAAIAATTADAAATIAVDPVAPATSTVNVTVSWSGVDAPAANDWVGAFCPFANDSTAFITYQEVGTGLPAGKPYPYGPYVPFSNASAASWAEGHGSVSFVLPNIRCSYDFLCVRACVGARALLSSCACPESPSRSKNPKAN